MAEVRIQDGESIENALRRFKRKVQQEDIIKEVKKHSFYLKPGEKKRIKQAIYAGVGLLAVALVSVGLSRSSLRTMLPTGPGALSTSSPIAERTRLYSELR